MYKVVEKLGNILKINSVNLNNRFLVKNSNNCYTYSDDNQLDSVSFKAKLVMKPKKVSLFVKNAALIGIPSAIATVQKFNEMKQAQAFFKILKFPVYNSRTDCCYANPLYFLSSLRCTVYVFF